MQLLTCELLAPADGSAQLGEKLFQRSGVVTHAPRVHVDDGIVQTMAPT